MPCFVDQISVTSIVIRPPTAAGRHGPMSNACLAPGQPDSSTVDFALNPELSIGSFADRFAVRPRLQIDDFLTADSAARLATYLKQNDRWRHIINSQDRTYEVVATEWDALSQVDRDRVAQAIDESAAYDFQYQYDTIRVPEIAAERVRS